MDPPDVLKKVCITGNELLMYLLVVSGSHGCTDALTVQLGFLVDHLLPPRPLSSSHLGSQSHTSHFMFLTTFGSPDYVTQVTPREVT